jgi:ketosteroid isomerase-like protein
VPSGQGFDCEMVMVFTLRNGTIVEFREFPDSAAINPAF